MNDEIKKLVDQIVSAIPEELTDEQIEAIASQCSALKYRPEIKITSDPKEFETNAKERRIKYDNLWIGKEESSTVSSTLYGDYEKSDFSINKIQIALVTDMYDDYSASIVIYVPEKREYNVTSYRDFIETELRKNLYDSINNMTNGRLTMLEIKNFVKQYDLSKGMPKIETTSNPIEFDNAAREKNEDLANFSVETSTQTLYGDYQPGLENIYQDRSSSDFCLSKVQVALVTKTSCKRRHNKEDLEESSTIVIYLPDEKEYNVDRFKQLIETETKPEHDVSEVKTVVTQSRRRMGDIKAIMDLYHQKRNAERAEKKSDQQK